MKYAGILGLASLIMPLSAQESGLSLPGLISEAIKSNPEVVKAYLGVSA